MGSKNDAATFEEEFKEFQAKFTTRGGSQTTVEAFRPKPPHIKRRGAVLHKVYNILEKGLAQDEKIKQVHRTRRDPAYTLYYAMHKETEEIRQLGNWRR